MIELKDVRKSYTMGSGSLQVLEQQLGQGQFLQWDYLAMSLYALLDWIQFRQLLDLTLYPNCMAFLQTQVGRPGVALTDPRLS